MAMRRASFPAFVRGKLRINGQLELTKKKEGQNIRKPEVSHSMIYDHVPGTGQVIGQQRCLVLVVGWYCYEKKIPG
jgi:hypothetical protein